MLMLELILIMGNYSRFIVPVKKLQFPPLKTDNFENIEVGAMLLC